MVNLQALIASGDDYSCIDAPCWVRGNVGHEDVDGFPWDDAPQHFVDDLGDQMKKNCHLDGHMAFCSSRIQDCDPWNIQEEVAIVSVHNFLDLYNRVEGA
mmetsp:Transcript_5973/g.8890  ORF Transcript_5973/g.8890 Transcript_5973/m.8890 type:complete len:100 (-) Transcript_5973:249-548(-)